jgi:hypothetical protein
MSRVSSVSACKRTAGWKRLPSKHYVRPLAAGEARKRILPSFHSNQPEKMWTSMGPYTEALQQHGLCDFLGRACKQHLHPLYSEGSVCRYLVTVHLNAKMLQGGQDNLPQVVHPCINPLSLVLAPGSSFKCNLQP